MGGCDLQGVTRTFEDVTVNTVTLLWSYFAFSFSLLPLLKQIYCTFVHNFQPCCKLFCPHVAIQTLYIHVPNKVLLPISFSALCPHKICVGKSFNGCCQQVCTMPQNATSYGGTSRHSHSDPRSAGWQDGVVQTGCQADTTCSTDVTSLRSSLTANTPHLVNGTDSGSDSETENSKANKSCPEPSMKGNGNTRRPRKNSELKKW